MAAYLPFQLTPAVVPSFTEQTFAPAGLEFRAAKDLKLDFESWDIVTPLVFVTGAEAIMQRVAIRWKMFAGEWFVDQRVGVPWLQRVFVVNPSIRTLKRIFEAVPNSTPGVLRTREMSISVDRSARVVSVDSFRIDLTDGSSLSSNPDAPFIIKP
jgi:hypothetical protein